MEHLKMHTINKVDENVSKIAALFPNCVTEAKGENGEITHKIDFDMLKQELSNTLVEGREERYQFTWPDKKQAILTANAPINKTLRPCREESVNFDETENLYIEGDNLEVLKLLQETYLGKIKMIYIDPPYNTGNDFVYNDEFSVSSSEFSERSGNFDEEGNLLVDNYTRNTESNGRFHTDWLNMMYPRLKLARDLLSEDGVIFISIDDNEVENLKKICDEVFGEGNFIGELIIQTATDNNPRQISTEHEYMLCYAKDILLQEAWTRKNENAQKIKSQYEKLKAKKLSAEEIQIELRKWIKENKDELKQVEHYNCVDDRGVYTANTNSSNTKPGGYTYDILHPVTHKPCAKPAFGWRWAEKTFWENNKKGDVEWGKDETTQPHIKKRIETAQEQLKSVIYEDGRASTKLLETLFLKKKIFDNPKSLSMIERILDFVTSKDSIILDFFSGSASTAHAVMKLNSEDKGHRKFILVQLPEVCDNKSEAFKAGYKNICEIGKERIRRAGKQLLQTTIKTGGGMEDSLFENSLTTSAETPLGVTNPCDNKKLDIGFRVLKCDTSNMEDVYYTPDHIDKQDFFKNNIKSDRTAEDLLFQVMLDLGIMLSSKIQAKQIDGKTVYYVEGNYLMACFDDTVDEATITEIAKEKPYYFVMRDPANSKDGDSLITNFEQIFTTYSPETVRKIL